MDECERGFILWVILFILHSHLLRYQRLGPFFS